jgi:hypothetical protein
LCMSFWHNWVQLFTAEDVEFAEKMLIIVQQAISIKNSVRSIRLCDLCVLRGNSGKTVCRNSSSY